jgi:type I restriction enzyme S subunit
MGSVSKDGSFLTHKTTDVRDDVLRTGDLVMPKDDIGGGQIIGKAVLVDEDERYVLGDHVYRLRLSDGFPAFVRYGINSYKVNIQLRSKVVGSAQLGLGRRAVLEQPISFPPLKEQEAIAEALSDANAAIESLDALIAKKRDVKQATMQQLLTGRTRLPGFTSDWKEVRLGEIYEVKSSKRVLQSEWREIGVPFFRGREVSELASRGKVNNDLFIDMTHYERLRRSYGVPGIDDLLLTAIGTIGNAYRVKTTEPFYFKDASVIWLSGRGGVVGSYVEHWMKSKGFRDQLPSDNGTTVDTLTIGFTAGMRVILPPLKEQEAIAEALTGMDDELEALNEQVSKLRMVKQGMMQDLLTGKVRLV